MKKYKFQNKILITNSIVLVGVVTFCFLLFAFYYISENNRQFRDNTDRTADSVGSILENSFFFADNTAVQAGNNPYIKDVLNKLYFNTDQSNYFSNEHTEANAILQYLYPYLVKKDLLYRICFYNENGDFLACGSSVTLKGVQNYVSEKRMDKVTGRLAENKGISTNLVYTEDVLQNTEFKTDGYIAVVRPVRDSNIRDGLPLGYLEVHLSLNGIKEQITPLIGSGNAAIYYQGRSILQVGEDRGDAGAFAVTKDIGDGFEIRLKSYNENGRQVVLVTIIILFIIATLIIISMVLVQRKVVTRITKPLISLFNLVQTTDLDDVSRLEEEHSIDEILELQQSFNHMMKSLQASVEETVAMRTEKVNAQMLALQAQVDPHFIHNTLAIISSLADEGENQKAKDVSNMLSSMIRYSSDYTKQETTLSQEIDNIVSYLKLVKYRYEEDFVYQIELEAGCGEVQIPKFIIQPLVENAIRHSLNKADFPWKIAITCYQREEKWYIEVSDNGAGIEPDSIEEIKNRLAKMNDSSMDELVKNLKIGGFSLMNILIRMYIHYKDDMEFDIYRNNENGTTVMIGGMIE